MAQILRDRDGDRGLAHAAGAHDGHEAFRDELGGHRKDVIGTPHHPGQARREEVGPGEAGGDPLTPDMAGGRSGDRGDEAVAPPGQGGDVSRAVDAVAERLAQAGDVEPQAALVHGDVGPDPGDEVLLGDGLVRARHQRDERVERTGAQHDGRAVARQ